MTNIGQQVRVCQLGQDHLSVISVEVHLGTETEHIVIVKIY